MKKILFLFLILLAACSDQEITPSQSFGGVRALPPSLQPTPLDCGCGYANFEMVSDFSSMPFLYNEPMPVTITGTTPDTNCGVLAYTVVLMIKNLSTVNTVLFKKNGVSQFYLSPGQQHTLVFTQSNTGYNCGLNLNPLIFNWSVQKTGGTDVYTDVSNEFLSVSPYPHTRGHITTIVKFGP